MLFLVTLTRRVISNLWLPGGGALKLLPATIFIIAVTLLLSTVLAEAKKRPVRINKTTHEVLSYGEAKYPTDSADVAVIYVDDMPDDIEKIKTNAGNTGLVIKPSSDLLTLAKRDRLKKLEREKDNYIFSRYSILALIGFNDAYTESVEIEKDVNETAPRKTKATGSKTRLQQFRSWYKQIATYYYGKSLAINNAVDQAAIDAVTWDFSILNASDPKVTLSEVMIP